MRDAFITSYFTVANSKRTYKERGKVQKKFAKCCIIKASLIELKFSMLILDIVFCWRLKCHRDAFIMELQIQARLCSVLL